MGLFSSLFSQNNSFNSTNHKKSISCIWVSISSSDLENYGGIEEYRYYIQNKFNFYGEIDIKSPLEWWEWAMKSAKHAEELNCNQWTPENDQMISHIERTSGIASNFGGYRIALWYSDNSVEFINKQGIVGRTYPASSF